MQLARMTCFVFGLFLHKSCTLFFQVVEGLSLALLCLRESDIEPFQAAEFLEIVRRNRVRAEKIASYDKKNKKQKKTDVLWNLP